MSADIWKQREVAAAFLDERSLLIPDRARQMDVLLRMLRTLPPSPLRILDLGCGNAILLATVLENFPDATGVALDFSPTMLEQAKKRLAAFGGRASLVEADLQRIRWLLSVDGQFDAVISGFAIHHLTHVRKRTLYREIYDLLLEGGLFLNLEHVASATPRIESLFNDAMTEHLFLRRKERGDDVAREQVNRDYLERADREANILAPVDEQCGWLREIGYRDVDCYWKYFELAIFGGFR